MEAFLNSLNRHIKQTCNDAHFEEILQNICPGAVTLSDLTVADVEVLIVELDNTLASFGGANYLSILREIRKDMRHCALYNALRALSPGQKVDSSCNDTELPDVTPSVDNSVKITISADNRTEMFTECCKENKNVMFAWPIYNQLQHDEYSICSYLAICGLTDILESATAAGCKVKSDAYTDAIIHDHFNTFKWMYEHGYVNSATDAARLAAKHGRINVINYLHCNEVDIIHHDMCIIAAESGHLDVLQWFATLMNTEVCWPQICNVADSKGYFRISTWFKLMNLI